MSTILKALRRLEEDRGAQSERPLREEVTRGSESAKSRRGVRPLLAVLLGLGVAAGAGGLAFWYVGSAPEPGQPSAEPTQLAAADSAEAREKPATATKRPRKRRVARTARRRSSPSPAPSAASEQDLPAAALASRVELMKRPPAGPRIAENEPAESPASELRSSVLPGPTDLADIPGRHKRRVLEPPSRGAPATSVAVWEEAPKPASEQAAPAEPVQKASRGEPDATGPEATEPRAEPPPEVAPEPLVVAVAPEPEPAAPEPPAASDTTPSRGAESPAATPRPEPTSTRPAAEKSSKQPAKSAAVAPREPEPAEAAPKEIARAEVPGLRVERTVWHPIAERRTALIEFEQDAEPREIREGDAVGPLVVSKIEPSGVVFVHDGVEVRRRIGE